MSKTNERTFQMMANYKDYYDQGYSVAEIASIFDLSTTTVYDRLGEIAKRAGVSREELLFHPQRAKRQKGYSLSATVPPIDPTKFNQHLSAALAELADLQREITSTIEEMAALDGEPIPKEG